MIATRRATLDDVPLLVSLMRAFYAESAFSLDDQWATNSFRSLLDDERKGAIWIVSHDDKPAGYVVLTLRHSMEYGGQDGFVDDLYVRPPFRRRGLGNAALSALFADCKERNLKAVHVEAARDNTAARRLYESFGLGVVDDKRQVLTLRFDAATGDNSGRAPKSP